MKIPDEVLKTIAISVLNIETLNAKNSDSLDFTNVSVWQLKKALEEAYTKGFQQGYLDSESIDYKFKDYYGRDD